ncbi:MAG: hypothetical protein NXI20_14830 [bacterium]|nr:hypothetical protein [bacterium]
MNYTVIIEKEGSQLLVNYEQRILKVVWSGKVSLDTAQTILNLGGDFIEDETCDKIILDRLLLEEFSTDARLWIKNDLLKNRAKRLSSKVSQMAMIEAQTSIGAIFSKMISAAITLIIPNLKTKRFKSLDEANSWMTSVPSYA